jgi:hypothetical protein
VSTVNDCRHEGKGDGSEAPPDWWPGHDEDGEEGEVTPPPHFPPREALPSLGDIFSREVGITAGMRRLKRPRADECLAPPPHPGGVPSPFVEYPFSPRMP